MKWKSGVGSDCNYTPKHFRNKKKLFAYSSTGTVVFVYTLKIKIKIINHLNRNSERSQLIDIINGER